MYAGDAVSRGPITVASVSTIPQACERFSPSSRIFATIARSNGSCAPSERGSGERRRDEAASEASARDGLTGEQCEPALMRELRAALPAALVHARTFATHVPASARPSSVLRRLRRLPQSLPRTPRLERQTVRARGIDFAVFSSPPVAERAAARLRQRRNAVRPLDALAGALAARRKAPGHSLRPARPRRVVGAGGSVGGDDRRRRRRRRRTPPRARHPALGRARAFVGRRNRDARRRRAISAGVRRLVLVDPVWPTSDWMRTASTERPRATRRRAARRRRAAFPRNHSAIPIRRCTAVQPRRVSGVVRRSRDGSALHAARRASAKRAPQCSRDCGATV